MLETKIDNSDSKSLLSATKPYAEEIPFKSWWHVSLTFILLISLLVSAAALPWWPVRLILSIVGGLVTVRAFILYHDFLHSSLLHHSRIGKVIFYLFGLLVLAPPRYWRFSHNYHHANVGKPVNDPSGPIPLITSDVGSFPLMSIEQWRSATFWQRLHYRIVRHPLTILMAYFTVFAFGLCILPLIKNPRKYWDGALSLLLHGAVLTCLCVFAGPSVAFYAILLPCMLAAALGAYLFYAQHNYEGMRVVPSDDWSFYEGALQSSSYMKLGPVMSWFTGNIGYHHIHHLNSRIPFYRLREAMAAVPEMQKSSITTLHPSEILKCFRLNLWDVKNQRLVGYRDAIKPSAVESQTPQVPV